MGALLAHPWEQAEDADEGEGDPEGGCEREREKGEGVLGMGQGKSDALGCGRAGGQGAVLETLPLKDPVKSPEPEPEPVRVPSRFKLRSPEFCTGRMVGW